ncbi:MAG: GHMP family kinase ATP-binding protein [Candidatus Poseidoniales archaeon]
MVVERCGGHITLLFSIWKESHLARSQGSRGAGLNIAEGVEVTVEYLSTNQPEIEAKLSFGSQLDTPAGPIVDGEIHIEVVSMDGMEMLQSEQIYIDLVSELRMARLLKREDSYRIRVELELPTSQGFGMSAAGLIAVARAFRTLTKKGSEEQYLRLAHRIERMHGSGLGDVLGISAKGVELRLEPGAPGSGGKVVSFITHQPILVVWQPEESRHTSKYIDDADWQRSISKAGERSVSRLRLKEWTFERWPDLMLESRNFADGSGLLEEKVRKELLSSVQKEILRLDLQARINVRLCMLGVSLVILPRRLDSPLASNELEKIADAFRALGLGVRETAIE